MDYLDLAADFLYSCMGSLAIVLTSTDRQFNEEYDSLVNPERDLSPTQLHGISPAEVLHAPKFKDIAGDIVDRLRRARIVAAHNISFRAYSGRESWVTWLK